MKMILTAGALLGAIFSGDAQSGQKSVKFQAQAKYGSFAAGFTTLPKRRPAFSPQPVFVQQPVIIPQKKWAPGHYEIQPKQVWVPGRFEELWVDPVYREYTYFGDCTVKVLVDPGQYKIVWVDGCYKSERVKVWVPGQWVEC